jgi:hypothetical protein
MAGVRKPSPLQPVPAYVAVLESERRAGEAFSTTMGGLGRFW